MPDSGQTADMRYVATIGNFDGVHLGHRHLIAVVKQQARERGLASAVFTFSRSPYSVLHPEVRPEALMPVHDKVDALRRAGIDLVVTMEFTPEMAALSSVEFVETLRDKYDVEVLVMGFNHRFGHDGGAMLDDNLPHGVTLVHADEYNGPEAPVSSTIIRRLIAKGDMAGAAAKLGRYFSLKGTVIHGKELGRTIGFPTANMKFDDGLLLPPTGAYAALATVDEMRCPMPAMVGVVENPTHAGLDVEVHIFGLDADIYGHAIEVDFVEQTRGQIRMADTAQLQRQLKIDREEVLNVLQKISNP